MEQAMPYRKIIINALIGFMHDKVVWINAVLLFIMNMEIVEWIKIYALVLGAAYTTFKFHKEIIKEAQWWAAFKKWNSGLIDAIRGVKDLKQKQEDKDYEA